MTLDDFARPELRQTWIEEMDAKVFQLVSEAHRTAREDLFLEEPPAPASRPPTHGEGWEVPGFHEFLTRIERINPGIDSVVADEVEPGRIGPRRDA